MQRGVVRKTVLQSRFGWMKMKRALLILLLLVPASSLGAADPLEQVTDLPIVKRLFSDHATVVEARDLGDIYEIVASVPGREQEIFYVTRDGSYLFAGGSLFNREKVNVTKERKDQVNKVELSKLPLQEAVVIKMGSGAKKLVMFTDVDCPFCRKAYDWLKTQNDTTLYVFLHPLPMHPGAHEKSVRILCDPNHQAAFELAQSDQEVTAGKCDSGENTLRQHETVAGQLGVSGTPLFITESGTRITGFDQLTIATYLKD
jgi:thiol:disulfide interchange protein DsbC